MKTINYIGNSQKTGVYSIRNIINNKRYIGSTKRAFHTRKTKHLNPLRRGNHTNEYLQNAFNKYGEENFVFEILLICNPEFCEEEENNFINLYKSNIRIYGYNLAPVKGYKSNYKLTPTHLLEKKKRKKEKALSKNGLETEERGICKPIDVYNINGEFIETVDSAISLQEKYKIRRNFSCSILKSRKLVYIKKSIIILYNNDKLTEEDIIYVNNKIKIKKVLLYDLDNIYIRTFSSAKEAALFLECKDAEIRMCCTGKRSRIKKYITKYEC